MKTWNVHFSKIQGTWVFFLSCFMTLTQKHEYSLLGFCVWANRRHSSTQNTTLKKDSAKILGRKMLYFCFTWMWMGEKNINRFEFCLFYFPLKFMSFLWPSFKDKNGRSNWSVMNWTRMQCQHDRGRMNIVFFSIWEGVAGFANNLAFRMYIVFLTSKYPYKY